MIGPRLPLSPETQLLLFRIAQEALSNVRRHSETMEAKVELEFDRGKVRPVIEDNGRRFNLPENLSDLAGAGALGLLGVSERARLAGGSIKVQSEPGRGTRVVAEMGA